MSTNGVIRTAVVLCMLPFTTHTMQSQQMASTLIDYSAQHEHAVGENNPVSNSLGQGFSASVQPPAFSRSIKKYCDANPGQEWHSGSKPSGDTPTSGYCPTDEDNVVTTSHDFVSHHKDFIPCSANGEAMALYMEEHKLSPLEMKSYEKAYKELKKAGQLKLTAKA